MRMVRGTAGGHGGRGRGTGAGYPARRTLGMACGRGCRRTPNGLRPARLRRAGSARGRPLVGTHNPCRRGSGVPPGPGARRSGGPETLHRAPASPPKHCPHYRSRPPTPPRTPPDPSSIPPASPPVGHFRCLLTPRARSDRWKRGRGAVLAGSRSGEGPRLRAGGADRS